MRKDKHSADDDDDSKDQECQEERLERWGKLAAVGGASQSGEEVVEVQQIHGKCPGSSATEHDQMPIWPPGRVEKGHTQSAYRTANGRNDQQSPPS